MIPAGTTAPSSAKRFGSRRNSTTSWSSAFASSAPATSSQPMAALESGLISCGLVFGISFSVRQRKNTSRPMNRIGAHVRIWSLMLSQSYQWYSTGGGVTACASRPSIPCSVL